MCLCQIHTTHSYFIVIFTFPKPFFIPLVFSPRYTPTLQIFTTLTQYLDSTWSSPFYTSSASVITSPDTSKHTINIYKLLLASTHYI
ncbi:hypothetical protein IGI04_028089 [Brassica rapa subsp. trilocularis]|uniref:Uncharacterized protein n=1 Tax=Brassica rapa subsp. trilocularis TaxID=1813537 RepID=A0ABQ7L1Y2_BRACM|nr:hypothetical protein IGI04_028089 [Brassica rapa subsp. trilocularis]